MNLTFILSMPGRGSWNGKWSGEGTLYAKVVKIGLPKARELISKSFHYAWSDGWCARIDCKLITGTELRKVRKATKGFCGYDWMIDEIRFHGRIRTEKERYSINEQ